MHNTPCVCLSVSPSVRNAFASRPTWSSLSYMAVYSLVSKRILVRRHSGGISGDIDRLGEICLCVMHVLNELSWVFAEPFWASCG